MTVTCSQTQSYAGSWKPTACKQHLGVGCKCASWEARASIEQSHQVRIARVVQRARGHEGAAGGGHKGNLQPCQNALNNRAAFDPHRKPRVKYCPDLPLYMSQKMLSTRYGCLLRLFVSVYALPIVAYRPQLIDDGGVKTA